MQTAINRAAQAVLPVYKTFPIPALLRETGWGPVNAWLDRIHDRIAVRIAASDPGHPLRHRWNSSHFAWIRRRQKLELSTDTYKPPWMQFDRESLALQVGASGRLNDLESYERWARERNPLDLTVFSDGSVNKAGKAGAGYCVYRARKKFSMEKCRLDIPHKSTTQRLLEQSLASGLPALTSWPASRLT